MAKEAKQGRGRPDDPPGKRRMPRRARRDDHKPVVHKGPDAPSGTGPRVGEMAPNFALPVVGDGEVELHALRGHKPVVLFFFPNPGTPNCNREAESFQTVYGELKSRGIALLGICNDPPVKLRRFIDDLGLEYPVLHDQGGQVAALFGAYAMKTYQGRSYRGVVRSTFLIDRKGILVKAWMRVHVRGHVEAVLAALDVLPR